MKTNVSQAELNKAISIVSRGVSNRSSLPVLDNILISADGSSLTLVATNLHIGMRCSIKATVEEPGSTTVPARLLSDFVGSLPTHSVEMELNKRSETLKMQSGSYKANIKGISAEDFPLVPTIEEPMNCQITAGVLRNMINRSSYAASKDESRPTLSGIEFKLGDGSISLAATDGYRLSVQSNGNHANQVLVVPASSLNDLARICNEADSEQPVEIEITDNQIRFGLDAGIGRIELISQVIDARFPQYEAIIPKESSTVVSVDVSELGNAAKVTKLLSGDTNLVYLTVEDNKITLDGNSADGDGRVDIDAEVNGPGLKVSLNVLYLMDVISRIDQPKLTMEFTQPTRPITVYPHGVDKSESLNVIMPMHPKGN